MAQVKVSQVNITIGEKEISLTLDEARELLEVLEQTLKPTNDQPVQIVRERIIEREPRPWRPYPYIWYSTSGISWSINSGDSDVLTITNNSSRDSLSYSLTQ